MVSLGFLCCEENTLEFAREKLEETFHRLILSYYIFTRILIPLDIKLEFRFRPTRTNRDASTRISIKLEHNNVAFYTIDHFLATICESTS